MSSYLYRYESYTVSPWDWDGKYIPPEVEIRVRQFPIVKETKCGVWVYDDWEERRRWVSDTTLKRFAHPSKEEALDAFIHRKRVHISHLDNKIKNAEEAIRKAEELVHEVVDT